MKDLLTTTFLFIALLATAQEKTMYFLTADRVFDGERMQEKWGVLVEDDKITLAGPVDKLSIPTGAKRVHYDNATLLPGLIEGHSHMLLYPYNITDWDTQVLKETDSYRTVCATVHAKNTLLAGFTTARDLGTEGAGYSDVGLKRAIEEGLVPGF